MRNYEAMTRHGKPDRAALKPENANDERTVGIEAHAGNEELSFGFEQKKCSITIGSQLTAILQHEISDLMLGETKFVQICVQRAEQLGKCTILRHLMHINWCFCG